MAKPRRKPTFKQKAFVAEYVKNKGNATQAALEVYNTESVDVAKSIGSKNLTLPNVQEYLAQMMKEENLTLKRVVRAHGSLLDSDNDNARCRAVDMGYYAGQDLDQR